MTNIYISSLISFTFVVSIIKDRFSQSHVDFIPNTPVSTRAPTCTFLTES